MKYMVVIPVVVIIERLTQEILQLQQRLGRTIIPGPETFLCMVKILVIKAQSLNYQWQQLF